MIHAVEQVKVGARNIKVVREEFESCAELCRVSRSRPCNFSEGDDYFGKATGSKYFNGFYQPSELWSLMDNGLDDQNVITEATAKLNVARKKEVPKRTNTTRAVAGFMPVVPLVLQGRPKNMLTTKVRLTKSRIVEVIWDCSISAYMSESKVREVGIEVFKQVISLEKQGYRVRLRAVGGFCNEKTAHICAVTLKREDQPMNLSRLLFPTTHRAFDRGVMFGWYVRCPDAIELCAFGRPPYYAYRSDLDNFYKALFGQNCVPLSVQRFEATSNGNLEDEVRKEITRKIETPSPRKA